MTLNPTHLKQHMRILRKKFGASSKIGRRASNVEEALMNLPGDSDFQRTNLEKSIKRQLEGIAELMSAGA